MRKTTKIVFLAVMLAFSIATGASRAAAQDKQPDRIAVVLGGAS